MSRCSRAALAVAVLASAPLSAQDRGAVTLGELARDLGVTARVLMIGAHPDDEDTQLITWLVRGRGVETAYLSLTRGDGGQNLIGNELGEALGAVRTEELLAARRLDGGRQYFARAYDFGYSKNAEETYRHWPHDSLLGDVVTVIRAFRPHVIVSVFSGTRRDGHGHHEVAGLLAREGYDMADDTLRFPAVRHGTPWMPLKFYRGARFAPEQASLSFDVGEYSTLRGRSYAELAGESRSQHKSQAFGALQRKGVVMDHLRREHARVAAPQDPAGEKSLFDGIDTSWTRFGSSLARHARARAALDSLPLALRAVNAAIDLRQPSSVVLPAVLVARLLDAVCSAETCNDTAPDLERSVEIADARIDRLLEVATGIAVEANVTREVFATGDSIPVRLTVYNRGTLPVDISGDFQPHPVTLSPGEARQFAYGAVLDERSEPWWLAAPRNGDLFAPPVTGMADDTRAVPLVAPVGIYVAGVNGAIVAPVELRVADPIRGEVTRPVVAAPAVLVTIGKSAAYLPANRPVERIVSVVLRSAMDETRDVTVTLAAPAGLRADSSSRVVSLPAGGTREVSFVIRGRVAAGSHVLRASASISGATFDSGYTLVSYDHIRTQRLYRAAETRLQAVDIVIPPRTTVAYIPGVGDNVAEAFRELGLPLTVLDPKDLPATDLTRFTAVVVGPRAYEAHRALAEQNARLLAYARGGGTVVVQYGQYEMMQPGILPYPITLSRPAARVTVEEAPVRILDPSSPLLNFPNRITNRDFEGWVQERSLYMPGEFDARWTPLLSMSDPGEAENRGAVLAAPVGRGMYVYTSLSLFRQLPAAVPGAARIMLNLIAASQTGTVAQ